MPKYQEQVKTAPQNVHSRLHFLTYVQLVYNISPRQYHFIEGRYIFVKQVISANY